MTTTEPTACDAIAALLTLALQYARRIEPEPGTPEHLAWQGAMEVLHEAVTTWGGDTRSQQEMIAAEVKRHFAADDEEAAP